MLKRSIQEHISETRAVKLLLYSSTTPCATLHDSFYLVLGRKTQLFILSIASLYSIWTCEVGCKDLINLHIFIRTEHLKMIYQESLSHITVLETMLQAQTQSPQPKKEKKRRVFKMSSAAFNVHNSATMENRLCNNSI